MFAILIILGLAATGLSLFLLVAGIQWTLRQVNADDCIDWSDCL